MSEVRRTALARFLRTRRAQVTPEEAGIAPGLRRRTPGLRREEVALLSGVGVTWYTWLEQGRDINPSPEVLAAIGRTLKLDAAATDYLFRMAGQRPPEAAGEPDAAVPCHLIDLVHAQDPCPAMIMDDLWRLRAWNAGAEALYGYSAVPERDRNIAWLMFGSADIRAWTVDWDAHARRVIAEVRESFAARPEKDGLALLMARLRHDFPDAARWLDERAVAHRGGGLEKEIRHPEVGTLHLHQIVLRPADAPALQIVVLRPQPGTGTAERLEKLLDHVGG